MSGYFLAANAGVMRGRDLGGLLFLILPESRCCLGHIAAAVVCEYHAIVAKNESILGFLFFVYKLLITFCMLALLFNFCRGRKQYLNCFEYESDASCGLQTPPLLRV